MNKIWQSLLPRAAVVAIIAVGANFAFTDIASAGNGHGGDRNKPAHTQHGERGHKHNKDCDEQPEPTVPPSSSIPEEPEPEPTIPPVPEDTIPDQPVVDETPPAEEPIVDIGDATQVEQDFPDQPVRENLPSGGKRISFNG